MIPGSECTRTREAFPDLDGGPAFSDIRRHLNGCAGCRRAFERFRSVVSEVERLAGEDVPDPGAAYWDGFLSSVRVRIDDRDARPPGTHRLMPAAAAAILLLAGAATLAVMMIPDSGPSRIEADRPLAGAPLSADQELRQIASLARGYLGEESDPENLFPDLDPEMVMDAVDAISPATGWTEVWNETLQRELEALDEEARARLREELVGEQC